MKLLTTLGLVALMSAGSAFAATTPAPTATPATAAPAQKHSSTAHCEKMAKEKKLMGDEEKKFVKECKEGKKEG